MYFYTYTISSEKEWERKNLCAPWVRPKNTYYLVMARTAGDCVQQRKSPETVGVPDHPSSASREVHVLAVDDSHVDRKVIERLLKISSCRVTAVESGRRALQYLGLDGEKSSIGFDDLKVNLIMTDYSMPGMTGYELLKKIKESSTLREIPVVIMSSENILARIDRCLEEGAEDFLLKPVKLSDVKRLKDSVLGEENGERGSSCKRKLEEGDYVPPSPLLPSALALACDQSSTPIPCPCPSPPSIQPPSKQQRPRLQVQC